MTPTISPPPLPSGVITVQLGNGGGDIVGVIGLGLLFRPALIDAAIDIEMPEPALLRPDQRNRLRNLVFARQVNVERLPKGLLDLGRKVALSTLQALKPPCCLRTLSHISRSPKMPVPPLPAFNIAAR